MFTECITEMFTEWFRDVITTVHTERCEFTVWILPTMNFPRIFPVGKYFGILGTTKAREMGP